MQNFLKSAEDYRQIRAYDHIVLHNTYIVPSPVNTENVTFLRIKVLDLHIFSHFAQTISREMNYFPSFLTSSSLAKHSGFM